MVPPRASCSSRPAPARLRTCAAAAAALLALPPSASFGEDNLAPLGERPDWSELEAYATTMTRGELRSALHTFYTDGAAYQPLMDLFEDRLEVVRNSSEADRADAERVTIPLRDPLDPAEAQPPRYWRPARELPRLEGRPPLSDLRIALDPGHIGGQFARMEGRWFQIEEQPPIMEGEIVLEIAFLLKERLEQLGAEVVLVRERNEPVTARRPDDLQGEARRQLIAQGVSNPAPSYSPGDGHERAMTVQFVAEQLFYRSSEIRERARLINEVIRPDITLCLHLNAEAWGDPANPDFVDANHLHVLINGAYSYRELAQDDTRFEMLQRLFQRIHEEELALGDTVARAMAEATGLPPYTYTSPAAQQVNDNPYLWARNLLANRLFMNPVLFLEPYVMNHHETHDRLQAGDYLGRTMINGRLQPSLHQDYVNGVVNGLVRYYTRHRDGRRPRAASQPPAAITDDSPPASPAEAPAVEPEPAPGIQSGIQPEPGAAPTPPQSSDPSPPRSDGILPPAGGGDGQPAPNGDDVPPSFLPGLFDSDSSTLGF